MIAVRRVSVPNANACGFEIAGRTKALRVGLLKPEVRLPSFFFFGTKRTAPWRHSDWQLRLGRFGVALQPVKGAF